MPHPHQEKILNPEQEKAVHFGKGPLLIIAGAGTGKTTVVTERIKHLITSGLAKTAQVLALTFTEKAAREMEERVDQAMPYGYTQMWISTFHSFCDRILRGDAVHIGLNPGYRLLSDADATQLLRMHLFELALDYFRPLGNPMKFIGGLLQHFSRLKDEDVSPKQYLEWVKSQKENNSSFTSPLTKERLGGVRNEEEILEIRKYEELARAYTAYEELKIKEGVMDFGDLITNTLLLFRKRKNILKKYQNQFKFILVDEFQDTNVSQYELIKLLAPPANEPNLTMVGDDNQSIYKFRGAAVSNILSFMKDFPQAKQVVLNQNYRSYQYILDSAHRLIAHNDPDTLEAKLGISKKLKSERRNGGKLRVEFIHTDRVENEAEAVAKEIKRLASSVKREGEGDIYTWKDFAILVRANNHAEAFVRAFTRYGIPYQFLGPGQLFRQPEVKELVAYLQLLNNFEDSLAVYRVLAMEYLALSVRDLVALNNFAKKYGTSLFEAVEVAVGERKIEGVRLPAITADTRQKLTQFTAMVNRHLKLLPRETAGQILYYFLEDTGILKDILEYKTSFDERRAANITKFFNKLKSYEADHEDASVAAVLDWILLSMELGESPLASDTDWTDNDAVNILTVHSSKGLEFPVVFLVNLVSQRFPTPQRTEQIPIPDELIKEELPVGDYHEEEERRLFYVGMTRSRDRLFFTAANYYGEGKREKKISPFVFETLGEAAQATQVAEAVNQLSLLEWKKVEPQRNPEASPAEGTLTKTLITYLSYSQIETFKTCPLHYKLRYILKIPTPPTAAQSFGTSVHAVLTAFYQRVKEGKGADKKTLLELLDHHWVREGYRSKPYEEKMRQRGRMYLRDYYERAFDPHAKPVLLEEKFTVPISKTRFLKIGGKIDRVDEIGGGRIEIIDYKTGRVPSQREVDTDLQLSLYAIAATHIPEPPFAKAADQVKLSLYYFDTQQKISTVRTAAQLEKEKERILHIASEIETSDFGCSRKRICEACEYKLFCEA